MTNPALELCALCPIESACERRQMLEHFGAAPAADGQPPHTVKGQPYRCWLLSLQEAGDPRD